MTAHFVTAIYTNLSGTKFNGNGVNIYPRYKESLQSIASGGYPITCFTSAAHYDELVNLFVDSPNVHIEVDELSSYPHHDRINAIKDTNLDYTTLPSWSSRCVEIMWGKFRWVQMVLDRVPDVTDVFWIDAGIFHGGLIPNSYRSDESAGYFDFDIITRKRDLLGELVKYAEDKVVNIQCTTVNHGADDYLIAFPEARPEYSVIGGIFGGKRGVMEDYVATMEHLFERTLDAGVLLKEEEVMYKSNNDSPTLFKNFMFNTWYHHEWTSIYVPGESVSMSEFFEAIHG